MDGIVGGIGYFNAVLVFCILVYVHEMGHYLVARLCGVRIEVFSIGFGRELFGWTDGHGTRWKFSIVPLGGYVRMFGEHSMEDVQGDTGRAVTEEEQKVSFDHKSLAQRAAIVFAGPAANFIFAIFVMALLFGNAGLREPQDIADYGIGAIVESSPADEAGLQEGDKILSVDGREIGDWDGFVESIRGSDGRELIVKISRDGQTATKYLTPRFNEEIQAFAIGVHRPFQVVTFGPIDSLVMATERTWDYSILTLTSIGEIFTGSRSLDDMGGPVKIVDMSNQVAQRGALDLIVFVAVLSINLGLLNLLPVPMLDGGHLLFYAIEAVRRKPLGEKAQEYLLRGGLAVLLLVMVIVMQNDIVQLLKEHGVI
ncbi:RIP metalloprotease RseP [Rhodospirillaceae bacterium KN72]|uniref:Zinc metalloprotease n=1 Tax=Pacificispira spongiicola TaxID=2729598 RepID=A0A7Y0HDN7_9PROT|nr:RIP metalloprotease RseP [Pacificispira spongiicola]NMM44031.1 RIP metalloprotease RseP [Pacificispira spongiicola]